MSVLAYSVILMGAFFAINILFILANRRERKRIAAQYNSLQENPPYMKCPAEGCGITVLGSDTISQQIHMLCILDAQAAVKRRELESAHTEALAIETKKNTPTGDRFSIETSMVMASREPSAYWDWSEDSASDTWYRYNWIVQKNGYLLKSGYAPTDKEALKAAEAIVELHKKAVKRVIQA